MSEARRAVLRLVLAAVAMVTTGFLSFSLASAYWSADGTNDNGSRAKADTVGPATAPRATKTTATSNDIRLTAFSTATLVDAGEPIARYEIRRWPSASGGDPTATFSCFEGSPCADNDVPDGVWYYTAVPALGGWRGPETARGDFVLIDTRPPAVADITQTDTSPTRSTRARWTVTFTEPVLGFDPSDVTVTADGLSDIGPIAVTGTGDTYVVEATTGTGDGQLGVRLQVDGAHDIVDTVGHRLSAGGVGAVYVLDRTPPTLTMTTPASSTTPNVVPAALTFQGACTTGDSGVAVVFRAGRSAAAPALPAASDASTPSSPSTTSALPASHALPPIPCVDGTWRAPVQFDASGTYTAEATQRDRAGNETTITTEIAVDAVSPRAISAIPGDANPTNKPTVRWTVTFSEAIDTRSIDADDFSLDATSIEGTPAVISVAPAPAGGAAPDGAAPAASAASTVFLVSASTGAGTTTNSSALALRLSDNASVRDAAGNPVADRSIADTKTYLVDKHAPALAITSPTAGSTRPSATAFAGSCSDGDGAVTLTITDMGAGARAPASSTHSCAAGVFATTITMTTGTYSAVARQTDEASNTGTSATISFTVDTEAPRLTSIVRSAPSSEKTNSAAVSWNVTFSEPVEGLGAGDFALSPASAATITAVTGAGATWSVSTQTAADGPLNLSLATAPAAPAALTDAVGNPLLVTTATGATEGYVIDKTAPRLSSVTRTNPTSATTAAANVSWTLTFSEPVNSVDIADVALSGGTGAVVSGLSGSGLTWTVTADTGGDGTLGVALSTAATIADDAGNTVVANTIVSNNTVVANNTVVVNGAEPADPADAAQTYAIDKTAPAVSITNPTAGAIRAAPVTVAGTCTAGDGSVTVTVSSATGSGSDAPSIAPVACAGGVWSTSASFPSGAFSLSAGQSDSAGNQSVSATVPFSVDGGAPSLVSITRATRTPTAASSVEWIVTFSEAVDPSSVNAADFLTTATAIVGSTTVTGVAPTADPKQFRVTALAGTSYTGAAGTLTLSLAASPTITDLAGNSLAPGSPAGAIESYSIVR